MFDIIKRTYLRYTVHTGVYMLARNEQIVLHALLLTISYFFIKFTYEYVKTLSTIPGI